jgi:alpha-L-fucosidase
MVELIDRYRPDVLWADIGYPSKGRQAELLEYYYEQVPDGAVNDRWGAVDALGQLARIPGATAVMQWLGRMMLSDQAGTLQDDPARFGFKTAEYDSFHGIPPFKWETTRGLGASFAYNRNETADDLLTGPELVTFLADTVAKNGNVLINVGPDSYGHIPGIQQAPLLALGAWMAVNGEAIYDTRPWQRFGNEQGRELRYTLGDGALYAIVTGPVGQVFTVEDPGIPWQAVDVLGAETVDTQALDGLLTLSLAAPLESPAVVVRYALE